MLHYVNLLVTSFVCLLFGAEQVVYSGFLSFSLLYSCLLLRLMKVVSVNQNSKAVDRKNQNNDLKDTAVLCRAE